MRAVCCFALWLGGAIFLGGCTRAQVEHPKAEPAPLSDDAVAAYRRKRDMVYEGLRGRFELVKPEGAFYIFPKAPGGLSASEFVTRAIENNVLVIPGNVFSERDTHFRISFATTE